MNVLVDTCVWSLAYRRNEIDLNATEKKLRSELAELIRHSRVRIIGPICQELLSGIRDRAKFELIRADLRSFDEERLTFSDFERAAETYNTLRAKGISSSPTDCLICSIAIDRHLTVFTMDEDFVHYSKHLPLILHTH